jgi:peptide/nickel transport system substrate-binding protein
MWTLGTIFENLIKLDAKGQPLPNLATSWEWGPNKTNITFKLRQGVKFHDGTDFKSDAVKLEGDIIIGTKESNTSTWDKWEVIDDYTVRLNLKQYQNDFWGTLAQVNMSFFSPTLYNNNSQNIDYMKEHPCGTGPFMFKSFEKDVSLKMVKNPNYWKVDSEGYRLPYLDGIDLITVKEPLTQQAKMEAGEGDILSLQEGKILSDMKAKGFDIKAAYGGTDFIAFDTVNANSQFKDVKVRQAVEYAINKQDMVDALGYGYTVKNNQMSPPNNPAFNPNLPSRDYDPDKAKALLKEAGFPDGLSVKMIVVGNTPKDLSVQQYLQAVGINVTLDSVDNAKFWDYNMKGWTGLLGSGFAVGTSFPAWVKTYFPPNGIFDASVKVPQAILDMIAPALTETDDAKAKDMSNEMIKLFYEDVTLVPLYSNAMGFIVAPYVKDTGIYNYVDFGPWDPEKTWLDK